MRRLLVLGAGGRDFHDFQTVLRDDPDVEVVGFTAAQIPGIDDRVFPASLAGPRYPTGIPIHPQRDLTRLVRDLAVDEVVLAYSDLPHTEVMHLASEALAAGAGFRLLPPARTMLVAPVPVVAVCAVRTGAGKSQTSRKVGRLLLDAGLRVALVRHPMPYGDLEAMRVQRFEKPDDIDASHPTVEEREEYEVPVSMGMVMWAGVDYAEILRRAAAEADVLVWDGGNNDVPFFRPDLHITVADPLRAGHEVLSHPGELNFRMADVVVVNKVDSATPEQVGQVLANLAAVNPRAVVIRAASPVTLQDGPPVAGKRVLVVEDGPTLTHGGMAYGAGTVAARAAGARELVDPRPYAVGSVAEVFHRFPHLGTVLPAMGYSDEQLAELGQTIRAVPCDLVVTGTPTDLTRLVDLGHPARHATYELAEIGRPRLVDVLAPVVAAAQRMRARV
jgi:predicted GTPase